MNCTPLGMQKVYSQLYEYASLNWYSKFTQLKNIRSSFLPAENQKMLYIQQWNKRLSTLAYITRKKNILQDGTFQSQVGSHNSSTYRLK